uniref:3'-5' exonuclease domain-containing protein n=1 Tax=Panagrolaimus sp. ES5 TaxID=591445 RepID=A0AC34F4F9_9BILA
MTLLQLSTDKWFCLIDVQEICKEITNVHAVWEELYEVLFGSDILGFAAANEFGYLLFTFPWLEPLLKKEESKILCLQKLTNTILASELFELKNFFSKNIKDTCRLEVLTKEVLGYEMDKTMQQSKWNQRPLDPFQKIYAVLDALVLVQIYKKLSLLLHEKLNNEDYSKIIDQGFVRHVAEDVV